MPLRAPSHSRLMPLLACLLGLTGAACTTERASLTHVEASLEAGPGLAQIRLSHLARGGADPVNTPSNPADKLAMHLDGQPLLFGDGKPVLAYQQNSLSSYWVPEAEAGVEFVRDGKVVAQTAAIELAEERFTYLILHGDPETPDVLVLESALEARIVRIANVRKDGGALQYVLLDGDDQPIGETETLAYGAGVTLPAPANATTVRLIAANGEESTERINCNPSFSLVSYDEPFDRTDPSMFRHGLLTPTAPESEEDWLAQCFDLDCSCDAPE